VSFYPAALICGLIVQFMVCSAALAETRVALVIGESAYDNAPQLRTPGHDAQAVANALRLAGFSQITVKTDLNYLDFRTALQSFAAQARHADVAVIYYAGHGMEIDGVNYLIPTDAKLNTDRDARYETLPLDLAMGAASEASRLGVVLLDACRNNPFANTMQHTNGTYRAVSRGLRSVEPLGNTLVVYAARAGTTAADGNEDSPFATALMRRLPMPGLEIGLLFRQVHDDVMSATEGRQEPFSYGAISGDPFFFVPGPEGGLGQAAGAPRAVDPTSIEIAFWNSVKESTNPADLQAYLAQFPQGLFVSIARNRLIAKQSQSLAAAPPVGTDAPSYSESEAWVEWSRSIQFASRSQTIVEFLAQYPEGPHVRPAEQRIHDLQAQGK